MALRPTLQLPLVLLLFFSSAAGGERDSFRSLTAMSPGDTIRYTVDGSTPDQRSPFVVYGAGTLYVAGTTTFKAKLYRAGYLPGSVQTATVYVAGTRYYVYPDGWNLVSLPLTVNNRAKSVVFRAGASNAYGYNGTSGYLRQDTLRYGTGYLLKFNGQQAVPISGGQRMSDTITLRPQWNLVGAISSAVAVTSIEQIPPGLVQTGYFTFRSEFVPTDTLEPGRGYWVRAEAPGRLVLTRAVSSLGKASIASALGSAATITISDDAGSRQSLFLLPGGPGSPQPAFFELPPPPPSGMFDARFTTNRICEFAGERTLQTVGIRVTGARYPLTIAWDMRGQALDATLLAGPNEWDMFANGSVRIADEEAALSIRMGNRVPVSGSFVLGQNYPNPFNPVTTIQFTIGERQWTTLKVFDLLGREVATLLNEVMQPGNHEATFDGSDMASGVYFYRLESGSRSVSKKFLLLR